MTRVYNLATGKEVWYMENPERAVILAFRQFEQRNWNWWDSDYFNLDIKEGRHSFSIRDWCGLKE